MIADRTARVVRSHFELRAIDEPSALGTPSRCAWLVEGHRETEECRSRRRPSRRLSSVATTSSRSCERPSTVPAERAVPRSSRWSATPASARAGSLREFLSPLEGQAKVLVGRCLPSLQGVTLEPLAEMLKAEAGVLDTDPCRRGVREDRTARRDDRRAGARAATARARRAALASTLGLRPPGDPLESLDPRELYRGLVEAWRGVARLAGDGTLPLSPSSRTCTGPTRRCSTCSTSSPSGSTVRSSSSAPRVRTCSARVRTGAEGGGASARCRSTR